MKRKSRRFMDLPEADLCLKLCKTRPCQADAPSVRTVRSPTPLVSGTLYAAPVTDLDPYLLSLSAVSR